jgi:hypothetical protein
VRDPVQQSQTHSAHWFDLLMSKGGEHGLNLKPHLCLFVVAHVYYQLC